MCLLGQFHINNSFIDSVILLLTFKIDTAEDGLRNKFGSKKVITLDAMRPEFRLGSLYEWRTENLLPGFTLWKEDSYQMEGFISERLASNQQR